MRGREILCVYAKCVVVFRLSREESKEKLRYFPQK